MYKIGVEYIVHDDDGLCGYSITATGGERVGRVREYHMHSLIREGLVFNPTLYSSHDLHSMKRDLKRRLEDLKKQKGLK